ncbi:hypothetical protein EPD60_07505 [Flaviaesturariibacter flavus]|uniref:Uncharacterized protein n=1 Tax=Flaviaesturariibacter flavus TaxID=2502780 RepID=A0A4R1BH79_9BACT|nr:hypothetical protein [Flaviaesturariibacter flavus]TCJ16579.1 hypothetical protein EPD60_07505 [Flaviaesturariibacter flavus]
MRNQHFSEIEKFDFLFDLEARDLFGKLDYLLKDGVHIQNRDGQFNFFQFIQKHIGSLKHYYATFFQVKLDSGGSGNDIYYFLSFFESGRGKIDADHRYFLRSEFVVIGILLYKIVYIDKNFELSSVKKLQETIRHDYEELKLGIYRLLAKTKNGIISHKGDSRIDSLVLDCLEEFSKIGWVDLDDDYFDLLPAFQRLISIYGDQIANIDTWLHQFITE